MSDVVFPVWVSIFFYLSVFSGASWLVYASHKKRKTYLAWIAVVLLALVVGFRGISTGTDSETYNDFLNDAVSQSASALWFRVKTLNMEPFIVLFAWLGQMVDLPVQILFFLPHALITTIFFYLASRKLSARHGWLIFTMIVFTVFLTMLNGVRQVAAMAVLLYAFACLLDTTMRGRKLVVFCALSLFAVTLHFSAIVIVAAMLMAYGLGQVSKERWRRNKLPYMLLACVISSVPLVGAILFGGASFDMLPYKISQTLEMFGVGMYPNYNFFLYAVVFCALLIEWEREHHLKDMRTYIGMMSLALMISVPAFFSVYLARFADYFIPFIIAIAVTAAGPWLIRERWLVKSFIAVAVLYCVAKYFVMGDSDVLPYALFLGGGV